MSEHQVIEAIGVVQNDLSSIKSRLTVMELRQGAIDSQLSSIDGRLLALRQSVEMLGSDMRRAVEVFELSRERL